MKAFVAVLAGIAAASAAPKADAGLLLVDPHASTGETVEYPNGAVVPDETNSVKLAKAAHLTVKAHTLPLYGYGVPHYGYYGKREAEAEPYYGLYGHHGLYGAAVVPTVGLAKTGLIVSKPSGAITPDYTDAQKEAGLGEGTHDITVPVVTGAHVVVGKREAEADPLYGLYGHGLYGHGLYAHPVVGVADSGLIVSPSSGAVTPDFTDDQKEAGLGEGTHPIKVPVVIGKREAEADPLLVAHPNGAVTPDYTHAQKVAAANHFAAKGYGLGLYGHGYLYGKRSADSDAYYGYGGLGYGYGHGYVHYGKRSADADAYYGYYGYPAYTAGYLHYGKRSADADAYYGYGYPAYGYVHYGKRSADADAYYGYYGYPAYTAGYVHYG